MPSTARALPPSAEPAWAEDAGAALAEIEALQLEARPAGAGERSRRRLAFRPSGFEAEQHAAHGLAWLATYVRGAPRDAGLGAAARGEGRFGEIEDS